MPLPLNLGSTHLRLNRDVLDLGPTYWTVGEKVAYPSEVRPDRFFSPTNPNSKDQQNPDESLVVEATGPRLTQLREIHSLNTHIALLGLEKTGSILAYNKINSTDLDGPSARGSVGFSTVLNEHGGWRGVIQGQGQVGEEGLDNVRGGGGRKGRGSGLSLGSGLTSGKIAEDPNDFLNLLERMSPSPSPADEAYSSFLTQLSSAQAKLSGQPTSTSTSSTSAGMKTTPKDPHSALNVNQEEVKAAMEGERGRREVREAVGEVEELLSRMELAKSGKGEKRSGSGSGSGKAFVRRNGWMIDSSSTAGNVATSARNPRNRANSSTTPSLNSLQWLQISQPSSSTSGDPTLADLEAAVKAAGGRMEDLVEVVRVGTDGDLAGEEGVRMDSVKRKRRKKISKHKYKKRRKATRAERKRLGK